MSTHFVLASGAFVNYNAFDTHRVIIQVTSRYRVL
jgi:hypothetical protein